MTNPQPKNNALLYLLIGAGTVIALCCCIGLVMTLGSSGKTEVKYVVSGTARSASITYTNETGGTEQINVNLPWEKIFEVELGAFPSIVAQNNDTGSLTCEIWINGEKTKTSTSTAQYGVVTCSDIAP